MKGSRNQFSWLRAVLVSIASFALCGPMTSAMAKMPKIDANLAPFRPLLLEGDAPVCQAALASARDHFFASPEQRYLRTAIAGLQVAERGLDGKLVWGSDSPSDHRWSLVAREDELIIAGKVVKIGTYAHPYCGGACERYQMMAWTGEARWDEVLRDQFTMQTATPEALASQLYKDDSGNVFLLSEVQQWRQNKEIQVHQLHPDASWEQVCRIALKPADTAPLPELFAVQAAVLAVMKGAGNCGSMRTHSRWQEELDKAGTTAMFQPWQLIESLGARHARGGDGSYASDKAGLRDWGLMNIEDYQAVVDLQATVALAKPALASYYQKAFGWQQADAEWVAAGVAEGLASIAVRFYSYQPIDTSAEKALREAILQRRPLAEIQKIAVQEVAMRDFGNQSNNLYRDQAYGETVLNVAVTYPEALRWLLEEGADANWANAFGKTPLMYAAQHNAVEAVQLLLAAGADPNARTRIPEDDCYYTLTTSGMSPLHYAVRYSGAEVVTALLDGGAQTFLQARNGSRIAETPRDWFSRFRSDADFSPNLLARLELEPESDRAEKAKRWRVEAEAFYQQGEVQKAVRLLKLAAEAVPTDVQVLSSLSLVALRAGEPGPAGVAALQVIDSDADDKTKADAWFNYGLVCESRIDKKNSRSIWLQHEGVSLCGQGILYPFLRAVGAADSPARRNKIDTLFQAGMIETCLAHYRGSPVHIHVSPFFRNEAGKYSHLVLIAVLHPSGQRVNASDFGDEAAPLVGETTTQDLGERRLTVFYRQGNAKFPFRVGGSSCAKLGMD